LILWTVDFESHRSILCGILLFPPPLAYAAGLIGLSTPWMVPSLSMVVQICSPLGSLHHSRWSYRYDPDAPHFVGYPGYWLLLGNLDVIPCSTNFIRKDSGCWCNLNLKIISPGSRTRDSRERVKCRIKCFYKTRSLQSTGSRFWCNLNLKIISHRSRTWDFTVVGRYNYRYAVKASIKLDGSLHGVTVAIPTNDSEIPGSTPWRYNLQIRITSTSTQIHMDLSK